MLTITQLLRRHAQAQGRRSCRQQGVNYTINLHASRGTDMTSFMIPSSYHNTLIVILSLDRLRHFITHIIHGKQFAGLSAGRGGGWEEALGVD